MSSAAIEQAQMALAAAQAAEETLAFTVDTVAAVHASQQALWADIGHLHQSYDGDIELSVSEAERDLAVKEGNALDDGSYPIRNATQLRSAAILAASKHGRWREALSLIRRRAKELKVPLGSLPGFGGTAVQTSAPSGNFYPEEWVQVTPQDDEAAYVAREAAASTADDIALRYASTMVDGRPMFDRGKIGAGYTAATAPPSAGLSTAEDYYGDGYDDPGPQLTAGEAEPEILRLSGEVDTMNARDQRREAAGKGASVVYGHGQHTGEHGFHEHVAEVAATADGTAETVWELPEHGAPRQVQLAAPGQRVPVAHDTTDLDDPGAEHITDLDEYIRRLVARNNGFFGGFPGGRLEGSYGGGSNVASHGPVPPSE